MVEERGQWEGCKRKDVEGESKEMSRQRGGDKKQRRDRAGGRHLNSRGEKGRWAGGLVGKRKKKRTEQLLGRRATPQYQ